MAFVVLAWGPQLELIKANQDLEKVLGKDKEWVALDGLSLSMWESSPLHLGEDKPFALFLREDPFSPSPSSSSSSSSAGGVSTKTQFEIYLENLSGETEKGDEEEVSKMAMRIGTKIFAQHEGSPVCWLQRHHNVWKPTRKIYQSYQSYRAAIELSQWLEKNGNEETWKEVSLVFWCEDALPSLFGATRSFQGGFAGALCQSTFNKLIVEDIEAQDAEEDPQKRKERREKIKLVQRLVRYISDHTHLSPDGSFIECVKGTIPFSISAPHGGMKIPALGEQCFPRAKGETVRDDKSIELAFELFLQTFFLLNSAPSRDGQHSKIRGQMRSLVIGEELLVPQLVIAMIDRTFVDLNRNIDDAISPLTRQAWHFFHSFIDSSFLKIHRYPSKVTPGFQGFYIDVHGSTHRLTQLGYGVLQQYLEHPLSPEHSGKFPETIPNLTMRNVHNAWVESGRSFETNVLHGSGSLSRLIERADERFVCAPIVVEDQGQRTVDYGCGSKSDIYFNGGFNVRWHGTSSSRKRHDHIAPLISDAVQVEAIPADRKTDRCFPFSAALARGSLDLLEQFLSDLSHQHQHHS